LNIIRGDFNILFFGKHVCGALFYSRRCVW